MNTLLSLLLIIFISINLSFGSDNFINFIPYETSDCSGSIVGAGWSILEYSCFSIDVKYNYQLTTHQSNGQTILQWVQFPRVQGKTQCFYKGLPINQAAIGSCYQNNPQSTFNIHRSPPANQYYQITITKEPYYPTDIPATTVFKYMGNGECSDDNVEIIQYITNNTQTDDSLTGIQMNWYCNENDNKPYESQCFENKNCVDLPQIYQCSHTHPFYNTSDELSGGTGAGDYSGTGSGSGGSGNSGSGGLFINQINIDKNNVENKIKSIINNNNNGGVGFKSSGDASSTDSHEGNYLTSFCT